MASCWSATNVKLAFKRRIGKKTYLETWEPRSLRHKLYVCFKQFIYEVGGYVTDHFCLGSRSKTSIASNVLRLGRWQMNVASQSIEEDRLRMGLPKHCCAWLSITISVHSEMTSTKMFEDRHATCSCFPSLSCYPCLSTSIPWLGASFRLIGLHFGHAPGRCLSDLRPNIYTSIPWKNHSNTLLRFPQFEDRESSRERGISLKGWYTSHDVYSRCVCVWVCV